MSLKDNFNIGRIDHNKNNNHDSDCKKDLDLSQDKQESKIGDPSNQGEAQDSRTPDLIPCNERSNHHNNHSDDMDAQCFGFSNLGLGNNNASNSSGRRSPRLSVDRDAMDYRMTHQRRGKCLIINNKIFDPRTQLNERKGTEKDADSLTDCFSNFNFEVERIEDGYVIDIKNRLKELSNQDYSEDDCFVVCVLTHGDRGVLWGRDNRYAVDDLYSYFTADKCRSLAGKPKLFFIQACQGNRFDKGEFVKACGDQVDAAQYFKIPNWSDFMIMYSTIPGYYSWRNPSTGSWFIQALVAVLGKHYQNMDLLSMLTLVNRKVAYDFESFCPGQGEFDQNKQVPCITSMLTRRVFLSSNTAL